MHSPSFRTTGFGALAIAASAFALVALPLQAQVGHPPSLSPYEDLPPGQNLTLSGGYLAMRRDPAGVAPKAGVFGALRYDIGIGGPASFFARYAFAPSTRNLLVPANRASQRVLSTPSVTTQVFDVGLDIALTGRKTWRRLSPSIGGGAGIVSDFAQTDTGAYRFGTKFAFTYGVGLRYVPRPNGIAFRIDATNYIWQYRYPDRYFVPGADTTAILTDTRSRSAYRGNWGLSAGVTVPLFR